MKVKEESEKTGSKLNIQKMMIMASGPITSWQIDGETMETVETMETMEIKTIFLGSKISVDGDCRQKLRHLLLGRKAMTNPDRIKKQRYSLPTNVCIVKTMTFPVVM